MKTTIDMQSNAALITINHICEDNSDVFMVTKVLLRNKCY